MKRINISLDSLKPDKFTEMTRVGDLNKVLRGINSKHTKAAAKSFGEFKRPVLLAWGDRCWFFGRRYAERLAADFPNARIEPVSGAGTFVSLDRPDELVRAVTGFCGE